MDTAGAGLVGSGSVEWHLARLRDIWCGYLWFGWSGCVRSGVVGCGVVRIGPAGGLGVAICGYVGLGTHGSERYGGLGMDWCDAER